MVTSCVLESWFRWSAVSFIWAASFTFTRHYIMLLLSVRVFSIALVSWKRVGIRIPRDIAIIRVLRFTLVQNRLFALQKPICYILDYLMRLDRLLLWALSQGFKYLRYVIIIHKMFFFSLHGPGLFDLLSFGIQSCNTSFQWVSFLPRSKIFIRDTICEHPIKLFSVSLILIPLFLVSFIRIESFYFTNRLFNWRL